MWRRYKHFWNASNLRVAIKQSVRRRQHETAVNPRLEGNCCGENPETSRNPPRKAVSPLSSKVWAHRLYHHHGVMNVFGIQFGLAKLMAYIERQPLSQLPVTFLSRKCQYCSACWIEESENASSPICLCLSVCPTELNDSFSVILRTVPPTNRVRPAVTVKTLPLIRKRKNCSLLRFSSQFLFYAVTFRFQPLLGLLIVFFLFFFLPFCLFESHFGTCLISTWNVY